MGDEACLELQLLIVACVAATCLPLSYSASLEDSRSVSSQDRWKRQSCGRTQFRCKNGVCIDDTLMCDGAVNCPDGSDETREACLNTVVCPSYAFRCDYGGCVDADAKCNGKKDCADGSDERGCPGSTISGVDSCKSGEFQCKSGQCIDILLLCDGNKDCADGSDETREACGTYSCPGFAFRCAYGACIDGDGRCNGVAQCADSSDEAEKLCGGGPGPTNPIQPAPIPPPTGPGCVLPQLPKDGKYVLGGCAPPNCPSPGTDVGNWAYLTYTCNAGFSLTGTPAGVCRDGNWFSPPPTCSSVSCRPLVSVSREITCTLGRDKVPCANSMLPETVANVKCKPHYQQAPGLDSFQMVCESDGRWSRELSPCIPVCGLRNPDGVPFVSNGVKTKFGEFPWHAGVYRSSEGVMKQICGGTLIDTRFIVSAAHCFYDDDKETQIDTNEFRVVVGKYFRDWNQKNKFAQEGQIEKIVLHEMYKGRIWSYESDIAIIKLKVEIEITLAVQPVCIDREKQYANMQLSVGQTGAVVGWGINENMEPSPELVTAYLPYVDFNVCYKTVPETFRPFLKRDKFCAGHLNGTSVCPGDSGGGLAFEQKSETSGRWYLQGIVSVGVPPKGADQCFDRQYSAFTRVSDYYNFISDNMIR